MSDADDAKWVPVDADKHEWLGSAEYRNEALGMSTDSRERWYAPSGDNWPLLCLKVYGSYPSNIDGVLVTTSMKHDVDSWFSNCALPRELLPDLIAMLVSLSDRLARLVGTGDVGVVE